MLTDDDSDFIGPRKPAWKRGDGLLARKGHKLFHTYEDGLPYTYPLDPASYEEWSREYGLWLCYLVNGPLRGQAHYVLERESVGGAPLEIDIEGVDGKGRKWGAKYVYCDNRHDKMPRTSWYKVAKRWLKPEKEWPIVSEGEIFWAWRRKAYNDYALAICMKHRLLRHQRKASKFAKWRRKQENVAHLGV